MFQFLNANGRLGSARKIEDSINQPIRPYSTASEIYEATKGVTLLSTHTLGVEMDVTRLAAQELAETNPEANLEYQSSRRGAMFSRGMVPTPQPDQYTTKYTDRTEIKSLMADLGLDFNDDIKIPPEGISLARAKVFQEQKEQYDQNLEVLANAAPGLAKWAPIIGGSLAEGIKDPINLIPFGGGVGKAMQTAKQVKLLSAAGMQAAMKAAARGAASNMGAAAATDAMTFPYANQWGAGLGWEQAAADITMGGVLGAGLGAIGHAVGGRWKAAQMHQDSLLKAALDDADGRPVDVSRIVADKLDILKERFPLSSEDKARDILTRTELMKAKSAGMSEVDVAKLIGEVQTTKTNIESNITSLKESVLDLRNERGTVEGEISMSMRRTTEIGTKAADDISIIEARRDAMMESMSKDAAVERMSEQLRDLEIRRDIKTDERRIELEDQIEYLRKTRVPSLVEESVTRARRQAEVEINNIQRAAREELDQLLKQSRTEIARLEPAIGDVYRNAQWEIERVRSDSRKAIEAQEATTQEARGRLDEIRGRQIKAIEAAREQQNELTKIERRILDMQQRSVMTGDRSAGEVSQKVLGEAPEVTQARERTAALQKEIPAEVSEQPRMPNEAETAYREGLAENLDLSESQKLELLDAVNERNTAMRQRNVLMAAAECITRSVV